MVIRIRKAELLSSYHTAAGLQIQNHKEKDKELDPVNKEYNYLYRIFYYALRKLCRGDIKVEDLTEADFYLDIQQKGVDMKIGLDISSLAYKKQVDQIILIAGDSDFVPAAKHARREGIDFILDPMWHTIKPSLNEHIDGLTTKVAKEPDNLRDPLCIINKTKT
ncbi:MAG: NYN domain-containing protein [Clostridiales bacterium]|nr:NYN domain-containing protein [Clostridiales bacterium]